MIKLFNKTKLNSTVLKKVALFCYHKMHLRGDLVVKVTRRQSATGSSGQAFQGYPYLWHLSTKRIKNPKMRKKIVGSYCGWVEVSIATGENQAEIEAAKSFLDVILHEMGHIKDFRADKAFHIERTPSGRRIKHDDREIEVSAENHVYDVQQSKNYSKQSQELILDLAIEIEKINKPYSSIQMEVVK